MTLDEYKLLRKINSPRDLKQLSAEELRTYCDELRSYIIDECSVNPGHLASSLGCVELAAALHYVFDTPADKIVWDVGHQTYAHKIITGRREAFKTKRLLGGISGHRRIEELPAQNLHVGALQPFQAAVVGHPFAYAAPAAPLPKGG